MEQVTEQIRSWLLEDKVSAFDPYSHAAWALINDYDQVAKHNREVRDQEIEWLAGTIGWPDDDWIIGGDGAGNEYVISRSGSYEGVRFYDHECRAFEPFQPSLRAFYEYCLALERSAR
jgi:hypothetical protein